MDGKVKSRNDKAVYCIASLTAEHESARYADPAWLDGSLMACKDGKWYVARQR